MIFSIVYYTDLSPFSNRTIPIGIVLQTDEKTYSQFDDSKERFNLIISLSPGADKETFLKFDETFKKNYLDVESFDITDDKGQQVKINARDSRFLPYLHSTFQNFYQFSKPLPIESNDPKQILDYLFKEIVLSSSQH